MTTANLTRRTALAGAAAIPAALAPLPYVQAADIGAEPNATDAIWAELEAAKQSARELSLASDAFRDAMEARLPERLKERNRPMIHNFDRHEDFKPVVDAWNAERNTYGVNQYDADGGPLERAYDRISDAQTELLEISGATMTDLERKLSVVAELSEESLIEGWWVESALADVRRINRRTA